MSQRTKPRLVAGIASLFLSLSCGDSSGTKKGDSPSHKVNEPGDGSDRKNPTPLLQKPLSELGLESLDLGDYSGKITLFDSTRDCQLTDNGGLHLLCSSEPLELADDIAKTYPELSSTFPSPEVFSIFSFSCDKSGKKLEIASEILTAPLVPSLVIFSSRTLPSKSVEAYANLDASIIISGDNYANLPNCKIDYLGSIAVPAIIAESNQSPSEIRRGHPETFDQAWSAAVESKSLLSKIENLRRNKKIPVNLAKFLSFYQEASNLITTISEEEFFNEDIIINEVQCDNESQSLLLNSFHKFWKLDHFSDCQISMNLPFLSDSDFVRASRIRFEFFDMNEKLLSQSSSYISIIHPTGKKTITIREIPQETHTIKLLFEVVDLGDIKSYTGNLRFIDLPAAYLENDNHRWFDDFSMKTFPEPFEDFMRDPNGTLFLTGRAVEVAALLNDTKRDVGFLSTFRTQLCFTTDETLLSEDDSEGKVVCFHPISKGLDTPGFRTDQDSVAHFDLVNFFSDSRLEPFYDKSLKAYVIVAVDNPFSQVTRSEFYSLGNIWLGGYKKVTSIVDEMISMENDIATRISFINQAKINIGPVTISIEAICQDQNSSFPVIERVELSRSFGEGDIVIDTELISNLLKEKDFSCAKHPNIWILNVLADHSPFAYVHKHEFESFVKLPWVD